MKLQRLYSYVRRAVDDYNMIETGDRIAIGISGGKDSLTLLYALAGLRSFYPKSFEVVAITVDLGYEGFDTSQLEKLCNDLGVEYYKVETAIKDMIGEGECSLCARLRKGAFMQQALELKCNKIAYAHNMDDVVETMLMALIYEGRFCSFWPVTHFDDNNVDVIRPLIYAPLNEVIGFSRKYGLPISKNPCPYDKKTKRTYVRELLLNIERQSRGAKSRMMNAVKESDEWKRFYKREN